MGGGGGGEKRGRVGGGGGGGKMRRGGDGGGMGLVVGGLGFCRRRFGHENKLFGRNKIEG